MTYEEALAKVRGRAAVKAAPPQSAVEQREQLIAKFLQSNPASTRANAAHEVYTANPDLYERCRAEETVDQHCAARSRSRRLLRGKLRRRSVRPRSHEVS